MIKGVKVTINKSEEYPTPYGLEYDAKGAYRQKKHVVVVGCLETRGNPENTIRIKYPAKDITLEWIEE